MLYYSSILFFVLLIHVIITQMSICDYYKPTKKSKKNPKKKISIITYNIQKFPWSIKTFADITRILKKHSIILLQECFDDTFSSLEENFPNYYICRDTLKGFNILSSGLVILSKYPIEYYNSHTFQNYNSYSLDRFSQKGFMMAKINVNGNNINVINTHLQSCTFERYDEIAILQHKELLDFFNKVEGYCIVGGDFNIDINDMKGLFKDNNDIDYFYPYDPTIYIDFNSGHSIAYQASNQYDKLVFDYFITKKNGKLNINNIRIIACQYSDHNPVCGIVQLQK
jgi:endonuclease/exonuclease/phosphatase family metal-dependent hydrolase